MILANVHYKHRKGVKFKIFNLYDKVRCLKSLKKEILRHFQPENQQRLKNVQRSIDFTKNGKELHCPFASREYIQEGIEILHKLL